MVIHCCIIVISLLYHSCIIVVSYYHTILSSSSLLINYPSPTLNQLISHAFLIHLCTYNIHIIITLINPEMQKFISRITSTPLKYLSEIRKMERKQLLMIGTNYYPAYPLMILTSLCTVLALAGYMLYYFFTVDDSSSGCYNNIKIGVQVLAVVYPIQSIFLYFWIVGSISKSQSHCWKIMNILTFGPFMAGIGFGGIGIVYLCLINANYHILLPTSFLTNPVFIQAIIYTYLAFILVYLVLVPFVAYMYDKKANEEDRTCWGYFTCILYYIVQLLLIVSALVMLVLKLLGPVLQNYILFQIGRNHLLKIGGPQDLFFYLCLSANAAPLAVFFLVSLISCIAKRCKKQSPQTDSQDSTVVILKKDQPKVVPTQTTSSTASTKTPVSSNGFELSQKVTFPDEKFSSKPSNQFSSKPSNGIKNSML